MDHYLLLLIFCFFCLVLVILGFLLYYRPPRQETPTIFIHTTSPPPPSSHSRLITTGSITTDPSLYPERHREGGKLINIPTRGYPSEIQQMGIIVSDDQEKVLPLYGRQTYSGGYRWNYYTATSDKYNQLRLPIHYKNKDCTEEIGCEELYDKDKVNVPAYQNKQYSVTLYPLDTPRYIPTVV